ncbi:cell division protein FtsQ/DivIB [Marinospirillum insulare]|uniref:Cell division protein FtsQ n=1 Tax=Marinospirillum insulare TaxID=217169 RepID=A0ABQ5ZSN3_9GAMM|nr:cell division protein FtsQ/DivIB [Marinospirillum insulare]GLR63141.1 hypothetical protein GCM10007878_05760 [Marinospirillum insulare]
MARFTFWLKVIVPLGLLIILVGFWLNWTLARPVGQVSIYGEVQYADLDKLQERSLPWLDDAFWRIDLKGLKTSLEQDPWLREVVVNRVWPDQIRLELVERIPWAHWNKRHLIDEQGKGFNPGFEYTKELNRHIYSKKDTLAEAVNFWLDLDALLQKSNLRLTELHHEQRGAWQLELNTSIRVLVGRDNIVNRVNRFLWAWQHWLEAEAVNLASVDLRYPNGLSVAWHKSALLNIKE